MKYVNVLSQKCMKSDTFISQHHSWVTAVPSNCSEKKTQKRGLKTLVSDVNVNVVSSLSVGKKNDTKDGFHDNPETYCRMSFRLTVRHSG